MKKPMKKSAKAFLTVLCTVVLISVVLAGIFLFNSGNHEDGTDGADTHGIFFEEDAVTIEKYETYTLALQGAQDKEIEWKSNNEEIATVLDGVVCGWKKGSTQILACVDGIEVSCDVSVLDNNYVPVIKLEERDRLVMDIGGTYSLYPVLQYNGKNYTDMAFAYSATTDAVEVSQTGVITAVREGEALVHVQGSWRDLVVEASAEILVIDVSTSIEVSDKAFDIYLNGKGEQYPSSADIGISIFDKDVPVAQENANVTYTELIMAGDVAGAATIENGVAYAKKLGTIHYMAEYTPAEGSAVRSAVFAVNVHESPYDIYMKPIAGELYTSFIEPVSPTNSVAWDAEQGAFHLVNNVADENDGRCFVFSRDYIERILKYTNAKSIVFEVKSDGISSGCPAPDQVIYQGFYPQWYDGGEYEIYYDTDQWQQIEIFFEDIPLDGDGDRKAIMLLSTVEGMYIRNIRPMTEGSFLTMDLELTTLGGYWGQEIEIGAYPHSYTGGINDYSNRVPIQAGVKTTVKYRLDDFLENGKVPGFGIVIFGGPEWNTQLSNGTMDRHTLKITNLRVTGEQNYSLDLSAAVWASGKKDTGFTDANGNGVPRLENGALIIEDGFRYDGHKITLNGEKTPEGPEICFDVMLTTLGNSNEKVELRFYPENFTGNVHESYTDLVSVKAGEQTTVRLSLANYLVDGEFTGIGFGIFGGPEWNTELSEGVYDRHNVVISNMRIADEQEHTVDLHNATVTTGFGGSNAGGVATVADGKITIADGYRYDAHIISFNQVDTYLKLDMLLTTLSNSDAQVEIRFYAHNFVGNAHESYTDKIRIQAGVTTPVFLDSSKYMVDGEFTGIGFGVFGGPEWNTQLADGSYDRHTVTVSNVRLEGEVNQTVDLSGATVVTGFGGTNAGGTAAVMDGVVTVTDGYRYDGHMITFAGETQPEATEPETTEPGATEPEPTVPEDTKPSSISMDLLITTLGNSTDLINIRFYPHNFAGNVHTEFTDAVVVTAGTAARVKLDLSRYLIDGQLPGIGFAVFGGPEWNTELAAGGYDRHTITISNVELDGEDARIIDLQGAAIATGFGGSNSGGTAAVVDGVLSVTGGFRYDGHMITFAEETEPEPSEPEATEPEATEPEATQPPAEDSISFDMLVTTLGNATAPVEVRFYATNYAGSVHEGYTNKVMVNPGENTPIALNLRNYLVDGKLSGIGVAIFGGPEWNTQLPNGTYDRHHAVISNMRIEGEVNQTIDLRKATVTTGLTGSNVGGTIAVVDDSVVISDGYRYDGHLIAFGTESESADVSYVSFDVLITTLSNSSDQVELGICPADFSGDINNIADRVYVTAGEQTTVKVKADAYLTEGKLTGIGLVIYGGPEWNTQISPGVYDRHTVTVSNVKLEGETEKAIQLHNATVATGTNGTGYTNANGSGVASIVDGSVVITNGFRFDGHKITFGSQGEKTYISMDILITTLSNSTSPIDVCFYPHGFSGNAHTDYTDKLSVTAGSKITVKLELDKYLVDNKLPGIGFAIFGGPEWNTQLAGGGYDRHNVIISNVCLEGGLDQPVNLSDATVTTGFANTNSGGTAAVADGAVAVTNGFRYDGHMVTFGGVKAVRKATDALWLVPRIW